MGFDPHGNQKTPIALYWNLRNEGGHLLLVDFHKNEQVASDIVHNGFHLAELTDTMAKIGYKDIQSETCGFFRAARLELMKRKHSKIENSQNYDLFSNRPLFDRRGIVGGKL